MSNSKEILTQEYEGILEKIDLVDYKNNRYNISDQHTQLVYMESIPDHAISGYSFLMDAVDFPSMLPMIGEEKLSVSFTRAEPAKNSNTFLGGKLPSIKFEYPIFKLEGKNQTGGSRKNQTYTLHYCSELPFININQTVYKSFKGMKYSDMAKKIYEEYIKGDNESAKPLIVEETSNSGDLYLHNMTPVVALKKIAARSISKEDNGYLYVFYEGRDAYYFITINKLMKQDPQIKLTCELKNISKQNGGSLLTDRDLEKQLYNVDNYTRENVFDVLGSAASGEGSSCIWTVDPIMRKYYFKDFDLRKSDVLGESYWEKFPHLGDKKPWTENNKMFIKPRRNMIYTITDIEQPKNDYFTSASYEQPVYAYEEFFLHKNSMIMQLNRNTITATITGDPRVSVGCTVRFDVPEISGFAGENNPEMKDPYIQGKYLVLFVAHHITNHDYKMTIKMIRDGFHTEIHNRKPTS